MKAIKFGDYLDNGGFIPAAVENIRISDGSASIALDTLLNSTYGQAYIYLSDDEDITAANTFSTALALKNTEYPFIQQKLQNIIVARSEILNRNTIHEVVQQKRPPVGGTDFANAYTDGGTVRDISGGSFPASLYNDVQDWKALYQPVLDLFRPLFHFTAPMASECVEVWG